ncbi:MAG: cysteine desulfurase family protein [Candidatus Moranbacteria bacterium]|nr:cysteine desulfurase family protein [Candidatus Moranbacteria bacterium]
MKKKRIYLDYAATTPVDPAVLAAMKLYFSEKFGNPMSIHSFGQEAKEAIEKARTQVARFLNCEPREIIFTSGATESNNLAIRGVVKAYWGKYKRKPHIITTQFEHHCVLNTCKVLEVERQGLAEVTYLPVYKNGIVKVKDVKKAIRTNTILVSIMYVNNEIGTVQPIAEIGKLIHETRNMKHETKYPLFHTDAVQAINYFDCDVKRLNVDLLSLSAHKIYGPKGVGALYIKKGTPISQVQTGGEQEFNLRAGTHNVAGMVGLGAAIQQVKSQKSKVKSIVLLRDYLIKRVLKEIPNSYLNGSWEKRLPNNANFRFDNVEGESIVLALDAVGIAASTGSACTSSTLEPSHVLMALGLRHEQAHGSLRLTLGKQTTKEEIDLTISGLKEIIKKLRTISGEILKEFK